MLQSAQDLEPPVKPERFSMVILGQLARHPKIEMFYEEFSMALLTDELLGRVKTETGNGKAS